MHGIRQDVWCFEALALFLQETNSSSYNLLVFCFVVEISSLTFHYTFLFSQNL